MSHTTVPLQARNELAVLRAVSVRSQLRAVGQSLALWTLFFALAIVAPWFAVRLAAGIAAGLMATTLFLTGHDCGHGSFTGRPALDRGLGRVVMLVSYQPASIWSQRHNTAHHRWPNLRGRDFVWVPRDPEEYRNAGPVGRARMRVERTTPGFAVYYVVEIWWRQQMRAIACAPLSPRQRFDRRLAVGWMIVSVALASMIASRVRDGTLLAPATALGAVATAVVVPFLVTMWLQAFGTFYNHTDPAIPWFDDPAEWAAAGSQVAVSLHLSFPRPLRWFSGNVFEHPAHHVDPRVPLRHLDEAQETITATMPSAVIARRWTVRHHWRTLRTCRLYDYRRHVWTDFAGRPTVTEPLARSLSSAA